MVTHYHKQRASKGIHVYIRARVDSQAEGCGLACENIVIVLCNTVNSSPLNCSACSVSTSLGSLAH